MSRLIAAPLALACALGLVSCASLKAMVPGGDDMAADPAAINAAASHEAELSTAAERGFAANESGWVARFFWSPQYCDRNRGSREPQCVPVQGFVLRDLIRIRDGKPVEGCTTGPVLLSQPMLDQILQFTLNLPETRASWRIYGRCSGLSEVDYAAYTELVDRRIWWPEAYSPDRPDVETTAEDLLAAIAAVNHEMPVAALNVHCRFSALESVDIRFDDHFNYLPASSPAATNCKSRVRVVGKR